MIRSLPPNIPIFFSVEIEIDIDRSLQTWNFGREVNGFGSFGG